MKMSMEDINLVRDVIAATPRPVFVQELAARFIDEVMKTGSDFVGVHWAYDKQEWFSYACNAPSVSSFMRSKCDEITKAHQNFESLATGIAKFVRYLEQKNAIKSRAVYIASRSADEQYFKDIGAWLRKETPVQLYNMNDLKAYLTKYEDCGYARDDNSEEIISLVEQEIVYRSNIFVRSVVSSWSLNVQLQRAVERRDKEDVTNWRLLTPDVMSN